jgi:hypothetical protein
MNKMMAKENMGQVHEPAAYAGVFARLVAGNRRTMKPIIMKNRLTFFTPFPL